MNPLTNMKNVQKLSEQELHAGYKTSWHDQYRSSAWIFVGGLPYDLTEGDIICIFSQYGEIVNINLIRDKDSGKSKGFCFICYEDQRSTDLAVDNLNGIKILNRTIRVDHVNDYKVPKEGKKTDEITKKVYDEGCAPKAQSVALAKPAVVKVKREPIEDARETLADQISADLKLPPRLPIFAVKQEKIDEVVKAKKEKKDKKKKKDKKSKKKKKASKDTSNSEESSHSDDDTKPSTFSSNPSKSPDKYVRRGSRSRSRSPAWTAERKVRSRLSRSNSRSPVRRKRSRSSSNDRKIHRQRSPKMDKRKFPEYHSQKKGYSSRERRRSRSRSRDRGGFRQQRQSCSLDRDKYYK